MFHLSIVQRFKAKHWKWKTKMISSLFKRLLSNLLRLKIEVSFTYLNNLMSSISIGPYTKKMESEY